MAESLAIATANGPLAGLTLPASPGRVTVTEAGPSARFLYRGDPAAAAAAFGISLPVEPCQAAGEPGGRVALWLGPDEWLLLAPVTEAQATRNALRQATAGGGGCAVDIGHRHAGLSVTGPAAATLLNSGCPLDLHVSAFPAGMCARTLYAKAEIVLWRTAAEAFRVEVWRSFAPYLIGHLAAAIEDTV